MSSREPQVAFSDGFSDFLALLGPAHYLIFLGSRWPSLQKLYTCNMFRALSPLARRVTPQIAAWTMNPGQQSRRTFAGGPSPDLVSAIVLASGALGAVTFAYAGYGTKDVAAGSKNGLEVAYSPTLKVSR